MGEYCQCSECQKACTNKPGWFLPGEAEKAAKLMEMDLQDFFDKFLAVDFDSKTKFVLSPAVTRIDAGGMFPANPSGTCVFYKDGKCSINQAKPFECLSLYHQDSFEERYRRHKNIAREWIKNKAQIKSLLGEDPVAPNVSMSDLPGVDN